MRRISGFILGLAFLGEQHFNATTKEILVHLMRDSLLNLVLAPHYSSMEYSHSLGGNYC
jgi:hypothetical protein